MRLWRGEWGGGGGCTVLTARATYHTHRTYQLVNVLTRIIATRNKHAAVVELPAAKGAHIQAGRWRLLLEDAAARVNADPGPVPPTLADHCAEGAY